MTSMLISIWSAGAWIAVFLLGYFTIKAIAEKNQVVLALVFVFMFTVLMHVFQPDFIAQGFFLGIAAFVLVKTVKTILKHDTKG